MSASFAFARSTSTPCSFTILLCGNSFGMCIRRRLRNSYAFMEGQLHALAATSTYTFVPICYWAGLSLKERKFVEASFFGQAKKGW